MLELVQCSMNGVCYSVQAMRDGGQCKSYNSLNNAFKTHSIHGLYKDLYSVMHDSSKVEVACPHPMHVHIPLSLAA